MIFQTLQDEYSAFLLLLKYKIITQLAEQEKQKQSADDDRGIRNQFHMVKLLFNHCCLMCETTSNFDQQSRKKCDGRQANEGQAAALTSVSTTQHSYPE